MPPPVDRLWLVCNDLLAAVVNHHGGTLPARQYVAAGAPAWDCELVSAWCDRTAGTEGDPAQETVTSLPGNAAWAMRAGTFVVTIVRCVPPPTVQGEEVVPPSVADEEAAAQVLYEDAQRTVNALVSAYRAGELASCHGLAMLDWRSLGPDGLLVAGELRVRVRLTEA